MSKFFARPQCVFTLVLCLVVLFVCTSSLWAQSSTTGALTGTVTDPSNAVVSGATVFADNKATGQERTTTTDASGVYKFSQLPPGEYSVKFTASGFKTAQIGSVTINITETAVQNQKLELGAQATEVTVESTVETLQTQNATVGTLVGSKEITDLPLSGRNYTQIIDLSPGVVVNVANAAAVGNGTQDINVNGMGSDQNNYMMDGVSQTNYGSGGGAQSGNFPGIAIPNPDSIQEFKIQTSQYDAQYGRNPGASVNVVTKSGTNDLHGAAWEFFRNSFLDGNDYFNKGTQLRLLGTPNRPEALNQNEFGGTIGGPIKKDKIFFFGSYQGFRQKNGIGSNGFGTALSNDLTLLPFDEPGYRGAAARQDHTGLVVPTRLVPGNPACPADTYRMFLGCVFGGDAAIGIGAPPFESVAPDGSNINQVAINILQAKGPASQFNPNGFYVPGEPYSKGGQLICNWNTAADGCALPEISVPVIANEDQFLINTDYVISSKHTLSEKYFFSRDPIQQSFTCLAGLTNPVANQCDPGAPENSTYTDHSAVLKLTSVLSANLVNDLHVAFVRETTVSVPGNNIAACSVGVIPIVNLGSPCPAAITRGVNPVLLQIPTFSILGIGGTGAGWQNGGNFFVSATNFFNTFTEGDTLSWNHGRHALRFGGDVERDQYNWTLPSRGGELFLNEADFLLSSSGLPDTQTAFAPGGLAANFQGLGQLNGNAHYLRINAFSAFVQDDIKVSKKLTVNFGVRWEYDGYPSDAKGVFTDTWPSEAALANTGSFFLNNPQGTLDGFVVQSNYNPDVNICGTYTAPTPCGFAAANGATGVYVNTNKTLVHGAPIYDFAPRLGIAWQPLGNRFVVRAGYGIFYDRVYGNLLANNQGANPPYSAALPTPPPFGSPLSLDNPNILASGGAFGWTPRTLQVTAGSAGTGATAISNIGGGNGVGGSSDSEFLGVPLIQEYNLNLQYEFAHNWVADIGYVGSHGTHLYDWNRPINVARIVAGAPNEPTDPANLEMVVPASSLPFNDPANANASTRVTENTLSNLIGRVSYLGFGTGAVANTNTLGDSLYNSLQAQVRHQFSHGFLLQASYTWSKLITNVNASVGGAGIAAGGNVLSGNAGSNDPLDLSQQYGLAAFNRPQRLVVAYSYDLPYKNTQGFSGKVLGGWTVSGVTTIQDGEPFTVVDTAGGVIYYGAGAPGSAATPFGSGGSRAELAQPGTCTVKGCTSTVAYTTPGSDTSRLGGIFGGPGYINVGAFGGPGSEPCIGGTTAGSCAASGGASGWGNSGVGIINGPGQHNWDLSLIKNTKIMEGLNMQFRAEFYNVWNHPQFNPPANNVNSPSFGQITSSSVPPRVVQFALKFLF